MIDPSFVWLKLCSSVDKHFVQVCFRSRTMSDDDDNMSDDDKQSVATNCTMLDSVPVDISSAAVKKLRCKLCSVKAVDSSALALPDDPQPSPMEWRLYQKKKIKHRVISRTPRGRLCNWCPKTFFALGWEDEFDNIGDYAKTISSTNKDKHVQFLAARKTVIKTHLKSGRCRMSNSDKKTVSDAASTLDTVLKETTRLSKPKMQFVTVEHWDDAIDGKFDAANVCEENVFGKVQKGIWKKVGRDGVYDGQHFEDKVVEERTRETDDSGPLGRLRMDHKRAKMRTLIDSREKAQKEAAVDGPPGLVTSVDDVLKLITSGGLGKNAADDGPVDEKDSSGSSSASSSESSDEHVADQAAGGGSTKARLESMLGGQKRTSCVPAGSKGGGQASGSAPISKSGKPANAGASGARNKDKKNSTKLGVSGSAQSDQPHLPVAPAHEAVIMDGRIKRLVDSLNKIAAEGVVELRAITDFFHNEDICLWDDPASREKAKKSAADVKKQATSQSASLKIATKRYENAAIAGRNAAVGGENNDGFDSKDVECNRSISELVDDATARTR